MEDTPIAVIGIAFDFPGRASSCQELWSIVVEGRNASTPIPPDRWTAFYDPHSDSHQTLPLDGGHFLDKDVAAFDAPFFSISPAEAACTDPQQRGLLEVSYRALENAGQTLTDCAGSSTSVYTSSFSWDYQSILFRDSELERRHAATGLASSMLANRISWFFDFKGPSVNVDSACSSSLSALHFACQDLRSRDTSMALVAGCNLILDPDFTIMLSQLNLLSKDNRCWSFDSRANGYARGEGFAAIILKRLDDAILNGDTVRAVIRSSALNQDGRTSIVTQPNGDAQRTLIQQAYARAGLSMANTFFYEAHGTGTPVGDPIEAAAIGQAFKNRLPSDTPIYIGATKANIGHLEGASGLAGLIKTILVLESGQIPPISGLETINPAIASLNLPIAFPTKVIPWPVKGLRRACINSFGFGGSNAVVILDDAYHSLLQQKLRSKHAACGELSSSNQSILKIRRDSGTQQYSPTVHKRKPFRESKLVVWSAADHSATEQLGAHIEAFIESKVVSEKELADILYTLSVRRSFFPWRGFGLIDGASKRLIHQSSSSGPQKVLRNPAIAFVFTGQGSQYVGMAKELMNHATFQASIVASQQELLRMSCDCDIKDLISQSGQRKKDIDAPIRSQPLILCIQIALFDLLTSFNIRPDFVIGHSSGEIAAAYACGAINRAQAIRIAYYRGLVASVHSHARPNQGMLAVLCEQSKVENALSYIKRTAGSCDLMIGCYNSPRNHTVSGDSRQLETLRKYLEHQGVFCRKLRVPTAYHSSLMDCAAASYLRLLETISFGESLSQSKPPIMVSSLTGNVVERQNLATPEYWVRNLCSPVLFNAAMSTLIDPTALKHSCEGIESWRETTATDHRIIVEIGPHKSLRSAILEVAKTLGRDESIEYVHTLVRNECAWTSVMQTAGKLFALGCDVDLLAVNNINEDTRSLATDLPGYPFNHSSNYWAEGRVSRGYRLRKHARHEVLGAMNPDWNPQIAQWRQTLKLSRLPWVEDHKVVNECIFPAGGIIAITIEAVKQLTTGHAIQRVKFKDISFKNALRILQDESEVETQFTLCSSSRSKVDNSELDDWKEFRYCYNADDQWTEVCNGSVSWLESTEISCHLQEELHYNSILTESRRRCCKTASSQELYGMLNGNGAAFGPCFQQLDQLRYGEEGEAISRLDTEAWKVKSNTGNNRQYTFHPSALDGLFQMTYPALSLKDMQSIPPIVPVRVKSMWIDVQEPPEGRDQFLTAHAFSKIQGRRGTLTEVFAMSENRSRVVTVIDGYESAFLAAEEKNPEVAKLDEPLCSTIVWKPYLAMMTNAEIQRYCTKTLKPGTGDHEYFEDIYLCLGIFVNHALFNVRPEAIDGSRPHFKKYLGWLERQRALLRQPNDIEDLEIYKDLFERVSSTSKEGKFLVTVGGSLKDILRGRIDPLQAFFETKLAAKWYDEIFNQPALLHPLQRYLDVLAHSNPSLKIFEVGAGTGACTAACTSALTADGTRRWAKYDFTDISPAFLAAAKKRFDQFDDIMSFKVLDIETESLEGYETGTYDVVVAADVLHAAKDLGKALRNCKALLKPRGKLIMFEVTHAEPLRVGFLSGLIQGWWDGVGPQKPNHWSPCLDVGQWHDALKEAGFSGVDLSFQDFENCSFKENSIIISTSEAVHEEIIQASPKEHLAIVINKEITRQNELAQAVADSISQRTQQTCKIYGLEEAANSETLENNTPIIFALEVGVAFLRDLSAKELIMLKHLIKTHTCFLWITCPGATTYDTLSMHMVDGLSRSLRSENPDLKFARLALDNATLDGQVHSVCQILHHLIETPVDVLEPEFEAVDGIVHVNRVVEAADANQRVAHCLSPSKSISGKLGELPSLTLTQGSPGALHSFHLAEITGHGHDQSPDEISVEVRAIGISFRDYLMAAGAIDEEVLGTECSGTVTWAGEQANFSIGDRVCLVGNGLAMSQVTCKASLALAVPSSMSYSEAASFALPAVLSYIALLRIARLQRGQKILIHRAAGGIGQLAVQISQRCGARVFVTAGTVEKRELLRDRYNIPESQIFSSRDTFFSKGIRRSLQEEDGGVDVVLNSLSGDGFNASWDCIAPFGQFIDISLRRIGSTKAGHMDRQINGNVSYHHIDMADLLKRQPRQCALALAEVRKLLDSEAITAPYPMKDFSIRDKVEAAFRHYQDPDSVGKAVILLDPSDEVEAISTSPTSPRFQADATYVIAGGFGGLGRAIARWMVQNGARHLLLLSRSGPSSEPAKQLLHDFAARGVRVNAPLCDIADSTGLQAALSACQVDMPPIRGCVQASMVLRDILFSNMTLEAWTQSTRPKVAGSWNLHTQLPSGMDFFVLLTSFAGVVGAAGQPNYSAGNTFEDALARHRLAQGEQAAAIDLGPILWAGVVVESPGLLEAMQRRGWAFQDVSEDKFFALLGQVCGGSPQPDLSAGSGQLVVGLETLQHMQETGKDVPHWARRPLFWIFERMGASWRANSRRQLGEGLDEQSAGGTGSRRQRIDYAAELSRLDSQTAMATQLQEWLVAKLAQVLGMQAEEVDTRRSVAALGVDSLVVIELRNWFSRDIGADIALWELLGATRIEDLCANTASKMWRAREEATAAAQESSRNDSVTATATVEE